jgi:predicted permease
VAWREHSRSLERVAIVSPIAYNLTDGGSAERVDGLGVSASYLEVLGLAPELGRGFAPDEDQVGHDNRVLLITHEWWQSRFGGAPDIVGRKLWLQRVPYEVIGVLSPGALFQEPVSFLVPLVLEDAPWKMSLDTPWARVIGRIRPGVTLAEAESELVAVTAEHNRTHPTPTGGYTVRVLPLRDQLVAGTKSTLLLLMGASAGLLLIICVNLAVLLLARAKVRTAEMAVRMALGASSGRILRQMLTESAALAMLGGLAGVTLSVCLMGTLRGATAGVLARPLRPEFDATVLGAAIGLTCLTGLLFGVLPALRLRKTDLNNVLNADGRSATGGQRSRSLSLLLSTEVALTVLLLIGTGLLLRSFHRVLAVDPGFRVDHALVGELSLNTGGADQIVRYADEVVRQLEALPGVEAAGVATTLPLGDVDWGGVVTRPDSAEPLAASDAAVVYAGGNYFRALGLRLLKGRILTPLDNRPAAARVAVINERLPSEVFGADDPIGRRIRLDHGTTWEVVGVVADVRDTRLDRPARGRFYAAHVYNPWAACLVVRTQGPPAALLESVRRTIAAVDRNQSVANLRTLGAAVSRSLGPRKVTLVLVAIFGATALALAGLGIYSVTAYAVAQRTRELSIRMALGAQRRSVIMLVLSYALRGGVLGVVGGVLGALAAAPLIAGQLFEVEAHDLTVFLSVASLALALTCGAALIPALRAVRGDLSEQLRG